MKDYVKMHSWILAAALQNCNSRTMQIGMLKTRKAKHIQCKNHSCIYILLVFVDRLLDLGVVVKSRLATQYPLYILLQHSPITEGCIFLNT